MWTKDFWKATVERIVQGAALAVFGGFFGGDVVFNSLNFNTWADVGSVAIAGAFGALVLSLAGNAVSGNGPAFTKVEVVDPNGPAPPAPPQV